MAEEPKQLKDFSQEVNEQLPPLIQMGKQGNLNEALEKLLGLEKQTRLAADAISTSRVAVSIVNLLRDLQQWRLLNEHIVLLSKRRSQLKKAVIDMVQEAMGFLDQTPDMETKIALLNTLRDVTAGKIFVEVERARLTRILAQIRENEGNIAEAADVLQEVQVETVGSMEKREKAEFILEQQRLCLLRNDYVRAQIISKKINKKLLSDPAFQDVRLTYFRQQVQHYSHFNNYLEMAKAWFNIYDTPTVKQDETKLNEAMKNAVLCTVLAPFDNEQNDLLHRLNANKDAHKIPAFSNLLKLFTLQELMQWPLPYEDDLKREISLTENFSQRYEDLHKRTVEHNISVVSKYYSRVSTRRLAQLLSLSEDVTESFLTDMASSRTLYAKIDRPSGIIVFAKPQDANELLNNWAYDISSLLSLVEKTCHLINRENMIHKI